jgi:YVTN family beta-propeller protein/VCBS repeat-containing protein
MTGNTGFMAPSTGAPNPTTGVVVGSLGVTGEALTFTVIEQPSHGVVSVWPTGGFIYTPDPRARLALFSAGAAAVDGFTTTATAPSGDTIAITVTDIPVQPASAAVVATVPVDPSPEALTLSPDDSRVYVAHGSEAVVSIIDTTTYTLMETVAVGDHPMDLSFSADGAHVYVVHRGGMKASVIDTATHSVVGAVTAADVPPPCARQSIDRAVGIIGAATNVELGNVPRSVAVNAAGTCAFVADPAYAVVSAIKLARPPD